MSDRYNKLPKLGSKEFPRVGGGFDQDYPVGTITSVPICYFCKNINIIKGQHCKAYNFVPEKYLDNHNKRDCEKFELDIESLYYKGCKHLLKR